MNLQKFFLLDFSTIFSPPGLTKNACHKIFIYEKNAYHTFHTISLSKIKCKKIAKKKYFSMLWNSMNIVFSIVWNFMRSIFSTNENRKKFCLEILCFIQNINQRFFILFLKKTLSVINSYYADNLHLVILAMKVNFNIFTCNYIQKCNFLYMAR